MSRPKKEIIKLSENGVITSDALMAYLNNELTETDKREMERLLKDDPFAADAMEGLQVHENKAAVGGVIAGVNKKVRERTGLKDKGLKIHWSTYAWAAAVFGLLIGIGFLMVTYMGHETSDGSLAKQEVVKEQPAEELVPVQQTPAQMSFADSAGTKADTAKAANGTYTINVTDANASTAATTNPVAATGNLAALKPGEVAGATKSNNAATAPQAGMVAPAKPLTLNSNLSATSTSGAGAVSNTYSFDIAEKKPATDDKVQIGAAKGVVSTEAAEMKLAKNKAAGKAQGYKSMADSVVSTGNLTRADRKAEEEKVTVDDAMKNFNLGDYKSSSAQFEKVLKKDPENAEALYFGGISDYIDGKTDKSEKNFDKLLKKGGTYTEGAKWYKANILLKKGKRDEAKAMLQDLSNNNSSYRERAIKKLAEMGF